MLFRAMFLALSITILLAGCGVATAVHPDADEVDTLAPTPGTTEPSGPPVGFGDGPGRNLVNTKEKGITFDFSVKKGKEKNVKWKQRLGTRAYGGPIIAGG